MTEADTTSKNTVRLEAMGSDPVEPADSESRKRRRSSTGSAKHSPPSSPKAIRLSSPTPDPLSKETQLEDFSFEGVLFDLDGTLVDSAPAVRRFWHK